MKFIFRARNRVRIRLIENANSRKRHRSKTEFIIPTKLDCNFRSNKLSCKSGRISLNRRITRLQRDPPTVVSQLIQRSNGPSLFPFKTRRYVINEQIVPIIGYSNNLVINHYVISS